MIKETLMQRIQSLTSDDMQVLDDVLTPSVSNVLNKIVPEIEPLLTQFTLNDERQGFAVGGSLNSAARQKQSQLDFLSRQPGAQPSQPQPPAVNPQPPAVNPQPPAVNPQPPAAPQPFDMSKYQGGTFSGGVEDSRNISLNNLENLGVDVSKYRSMTATDTSGPKFQGLSMNEIFAMDEQTARDTLGFDPSDPDASPEFEKFIQSEFERTGPIGVGPGGPAGMKTEFTNQDELSQILNRAIPNYMRYAKEIGEDYTLDEMLTMSDDELAMIEDRYDKKMGYGRAGFKYGSDRYGQSKKIKSAMNVDYNDPFNKLMGNDSGRFIKSTSSLTRYAKNLSKLKNSKQAKAALRKSLLVQNEKARKEALKRLSLLQKMYAGGKKSV